MENKQKRFAIIVAGGSGTRMGNVIPKQFMLLNEKPILIITLEKFLSSRLYEIILVLPEKDLGYWNSYILPKFPKIAHEIEHQHINVVSGGETRYQSVSNGLAAIEQKEGLVAIHDGVRPLINHNLISKSFEIAAIKGSAVLSVDSKDSIRIIDEEGKNKHVNRAAVKLIQTPQTFDLNLLRQAYLLGERDFFTDDASVFEFAGNEIELIEGSYENIKITTPEDILLAKDILGNL